MSNVPGMTITPPANPFVKRTVGTRGLERAEGKWKQDHTYPVVRVAGGELRYGVVTHTDGTAWGRWRYFKERK